MKDISDYTGWGLRRESSGSETMLWRSVLTVVTGVECAQNEAAERQGSQLVPLTLQGLQTAGRAQVQRRQLVVSQVQLREMFYWLQSVAFNTTEAI